MLIILLQMSTSEECFKFIANYWTLDMYKTCIAEWTDIKAFITNESKYKSRCGTYWQHNKFISPDGVCPNCDTRSQPFLSNPRNAYLVMKYIDPRYWKFIFTHSMNT
jgi:hypothetical protein